MRSLLPLLLVLSSGCRKAGGPDPAVVAASEEAAVDAAEDWLALVDAGAYGESWDAAAPLFRQQVTRAEWARQVERVRTPLGEVENRELWRTQYRRALPGAPSGEYVVVDLHSAFEAKDEALERVTMARSGEGHWRPVGYFIL